MFIAFQKKADGILPAMIKLRTASRYSHCEIVLSGGIGRKSDCFSATIEDGVRRRDLVLGPETWDLIPVSVDQARLARVMSSETGKPYDLVGMLLFGSPFSDSFQDKKRWFCSELCAHVLRLTKPWRQSPGSIFEALTAV